MSGLETAQLAIYAVLCLPVLYLFIKHGGPGFIGWLYLFIFCTLRVVGGAMALSKGSGDENAAIISNIGLSPLLLAISGILHEARHYRTVHGSTKMEWALVLMYHLLVTSGLALLASGASAFKSSGTGTHSSSSDAGLLKGGILILLLSWVVVALWTVVSLLPSQFNRNALCFREGTKLLHATLLTLPLSGIRMIYSTISILAPSRSLNPVNGSLGLRLGLSFIPELLAVLVFIAAGVVTRNVKQVARTGGGGERSGKHHHHENHHRRSRGSKRGSAYV